MYQPVIKLVKTFDEMHYSFIGLQGTGGQGTGSTLVDLDQAVVPKRALRQESIP
jgi:hypothetical protein